MESKLNSTNLELNLLPKCNENSPVNEEETNGHMARKAEMHTKFWPPLPLPGQEVPRKTYVSAEGQY